MIDIHSHILPGLDDGSKSLEESLDMAAMAVEGGTDTMVVTPHSNQVGRFENYESTGECARVYEEFVQALKRYHIPLQTYRATEIFGTGDVTELLRKREVVSINHTGYYLVEFPFDMHPEEITSGLEGIKRGGGRPIIAHPERYYCVQDDPNLVYEWMKTGSLSQANAASFLGKFGREEEAAVHILLEHQLITCLGSDCHGSRWRTPLMAEARDYIIRKYGGQTAEYLLEYAPSRILRGESFSNRNIRSVEMRFRHY